MFEGFANVWAIVGLVRDFRAGQLYPLTLAGEKVVLFRDDAGRMAALIDRCPHRGVALSLGKLADGRLECPFHGWQFDGQGRNCFVPWNPDAKHDTLGATALPVREAGGLVWLHTGPDPVDEPVPSETLLRDDVVLCSQSARWRVHWTRAMENMLDSPHLPFVHKGSIGRGLRGMVHKRMDLTWTPQPYGATIANRVEGKDRDSRLDYRFPNAMELFIDPPGRVFRMIAICHPEDAQHTRLTIITIRNFARSRLFDPLFRWSNRRIALEDQHILESSSPLEVPPAGQEKSVRTDAPTLAFRKIWFDRLSGSKAAM
ncbi:MAG: hypothetical protein RLZZ08_1205 [Pseudomonadota bacterium]|jgi:phenylpropionate dioxygenase-like ring-hydroxylating dioxygenase large terminal subunit